MIPTHVTKFVLEHRQHTVHIHFFTIGSVPYLEAFGSIRDVTSDAIRGSSKTLI